MSERLKVMRELSEWVKQYGWKVYYNQKNGQNYPTFHANTNSKPDLLLYKGKYNVLVEVKIGKDHQDILNGIDQIWKYAGEYYTGRVSYKTKYKSLSIDTFVLATHYSRMGYLYAREAELNYIETDYLVMKECLIEKPTTHNVTRILWREWEKGFVSDYYEELRIGKAKPSIILPQKPKIGVLIAKTELNRQVYGVPYLYLNSNKFVPMKYNEIYCFSK